MSLHAESGPLAGDARLEAFSDAIFGFAATLLVVSLEVPRTYDALVENLRGFVAFGLAFALLVGIWVVHRGYFKRYPLSDARTVALNTLLLFVVLFYVYPLKFLTSTFVAAFLSPIIGGAAPPMIGRGGLRGVFVIYGAGWTAVFGVVALLYAHAIQRRDVLRLTDEQVREARLYVGQYVIFVAVGLVSVTLALGGIGVRVGVPGWAYGLLGPALSVYWRERDNGKRENGEKRE